MGVFWLNGVGGGGGGRGGIGRVGGWINDGGVGGARVVRVLGVSAQCARA